MLDFESWDLWDEFCNIITQSERIAEKKKKLKKMHDNGEPKPHWKTKEGQAVARYTNSNNSMFDLKFSESIPRWCVVDNVAEMKKELKRKHDAGEPKPHCKTKEGRAVSRYMSYSNECFDKSFCESVPRWVKKNSIAEKKKELKRMHDKGEPKPKQTTKAGYALWSYAKPSSGCFDENFRESLPRWFDRAANKKKELKRMYDSGEAKPTCKSKAGKALRNYMAPSSRSYDPKLLEYLAEWFE